MEIETDTFKKKEYNYLINPQHPDFKFIKLTGTEDFSFDIRF